MRRHRCSCALKPGVDFWRRREEGVDWSLTLKSCHQWKPASILFKTVLLFPLSSYLGRRVDFLWLNFVGREALAPSCRSSWNNVGGHRWLRGSSSWCSWYDKMLWRAAFDWYAAILNMDRCRGCRKVRNISCSAAGVARCCWCWKGLEGCLSVHQVRYRSGMLGGGEESLQLMRYGRRHSRGWNTRDQRPMDKMRPCKWDGILPAMSMPAASPSWCVMLLCRTWCHCGDFKASMFPLLRGRLAHRGYCYTHYPFGI